jgi:hypothetical protein
LLWKFKKVVHFLFVILKGKRKGKKKWRKTLTLRGSGSSASELLWFSGNKIAWPSLGGEEAPSVVAEEETPGSLLLKKYSHKEIKKLVRQKSSVAQHPPNSSPRRSQWLMSDGLAMNLANNDGVSVLLHSQ